MRCQHKALQLLGVIILAITMVIGIASPVWADQDDHDNNHSSNNCDNNTDANNQEKTRQFFEKAKYKNLENYSPHETFSLGDNSGG